MSEFNSSVQFRRSVVSNSLQPHGLQHIRLPCLSPTPGVYSNSWPLSRWCHPTISSCVVPFSCFLKIFPSIRVFSHRSVLHIRWPKNWSFSFNISQFFTSGGQSIGVSASASVLPMNTKDWFPLAVAGWISLKSKGLSRVFFPTSQFRSINSLVLSFLYSPTLTSMCDYWKKQLYC